MTTTDSLDDYQLGDLVGRGGMGQVFAARHRSGRNVVVKRLRHTLQGNASMLDRFGLEGRLSQRVQHPNVIRVLGHGTNADGSPFIVMDHVPGRTLGEIVKGGDPLPLARTGSIALQLLRGLAAIHDAGVVHADIKSNNILVETIAGDDRVTIIDFGLARTMTSGAISDDDVIAGTPEYMAPEVIGGATPTIAADIYAAGIIIFEMLTGATPFAGAQLTEIFARQLTETVALPPSLGYLAGTDVERVLLRALDKSPQQRFRNAHSFATAFEHALAEVAAAEVEWPEERTRQDSANLTLSNLLPFDPLHVESEAVERCRAELYDVLESPAADPIIVAYLSLADALIADDQPLVAVRELEGALVLLLPRTGTPPSSLWRITILLAALYGQLGNKIRARRAAMDAHEQATKSGSLLGVKQTNTLLRRLVRSRGRTSLQIDRTADGSSEHAVLQRRAR